MQTPTSTLADAPQVDEEALHKRRRLLSDGAEELYRGAGWNVYQLWREQNKRLFGRQMQHCGIQFGLAGRAYRSEGAACPEEPCSYGRWWHQGQVITLHRRFLRRDGRRWWLHHERLGARFVKDVLLHQMMHQYICVVRRAGDQDFEDQRPMDRSAEPGGTARPPRVSPDNNPHNGSLWIGEVNRLSEVLETSGGKAAVMPEDSKDGELPDGILSPRETVLWPYLSRPDGYYDADPEAVFAEELPSVG